MQTPDPAASRPRFGQDLYCSAVRTSRARARLRERTMVAENEFWIESPEVVRLFPTFVWKCRLRPKAHRPINAAILNRLDEMRRGLPSLARGEAWQSGHRL